MNFCHKIFHIDGPSENEIYRKTLTNNMNSYLMDYSSELKIETIKISNSEEYKSFFKLNPEIRIHPDGYELDNINGWRWGELGIWASNYSAWKEFAKSDYDYAILMEDDISYHEDFKDTLSLYMKELPEDWDVFLCGIPGNELWKYKEWSIKNYSDNLCEAYQDWSMVCYVINKRSVNKILKHLQEHVVDLPLDWFFMRQKNYFNVVTIKSTSNIPCHIENIESTFQTKQERCKVDAIF